MSRYRYTPHEQMLTTVAEIDEAIRPRLMSSEEALEFLVELTDALAWRIERLRTELQAQKGADEL